MKLHQHHKWEIQVLQEIQQWIVLEVQELEKIFKLKIQIKKCQVNKINKLRIDY